MVTGALSEEALKSVQADTQAVVSYMGGEYLNLGRDTEEQRKERDAELDNYDSKMYTVIAQLSREDVKRPGFSAFLVAAGMHLAILKERAVLRPEEVKR